MLSPGNPSHNSHRGPPSSADSIASLQLEVEGSDAITRSLSRLQTCFQKDLSWRGVRRVRIRKGIQFLRQSFPLDNRAPLARRKARPAPNASFRVNRERPRIRKTRLPCRRVDRVPQAHRCAVQIPLAPVRDHARSAHGLAPPALPIKSRSLRPPDLRPRSIRTHRQTNPDPGANSTPSMLCNSPAKPAHLPPRTRRGDISLHRLAPLPTLCDIAHSRAFLTCSKMSQD